MQRLLDLEAELTNFGRQTMRIVIAEQKRQILCLGKVFPRLSNASTTTSYDRKRMLRLLIGDITVINGHEPRLLLLKIRWQGGAAETIEVHRQPKRAEAIHYPDAFVANICALSAPKLLFGYASYSSSTRRHHDCAQLTS
jgi:hypothetical protein